MGPHPRKKMVSSPYAARMFAKKFRYPLVNWSSDGDGCVGEKEKVKDGKRERRKEDERNGKSKKKEF